MSHEQSPQLISPCHYIGGNREVLVKHKAVHFLKAMVSGLSSIIMFILLLQPQASTLAQLYHCWYLLLRPEIPTEVSDNLIRDARHCCRSGPCCKCFMHHSCTSEAAQSALHFVNAWHHLLLLMSATTARARLDCICNPAGFTINGSVGHRESGTL